MAALPLWPGAHLAHVYLDAPDRGPLGYCTGTGPDAPFDPEAALTEGGWEVMVCREVSVASRHLDVSGVALVTC